MRYWLLLSTFDSLHIATFLAVLYGIKSHPVRRLRRLSSLTRSRRRP